MSRIPQLEAFLLENPTDSFVKFALALEYIKSRDDQRALAYFNEIAESDPGYAGTYYHLGKLHERQHDRKLAESVYRRGLDMTRSSDPHAFNELQQALSDLLFNDDENPS